jgi:hypothetical protein
MAAIGGDAETPLAASANTVLPHQLLHPLLVRAASRRPSAPPHGSSLDAPSGYEAHVHYSAPTPSTCYRPNQRPPASRRPSPLPLRLHLYALRGSLTLRLGRQRRVRLRSRLLSAATSFFTI